MGFDKYDGKKEVRFGGSSKKFRPDPGKYEVEILDDIDKSFNEKSGNTSLVFNFRTVGFVGEQGDASNIGLTVRVWFPDNVGIAKDKLTAVIYAAGQVPYFRELYDEVPNMSDPNWPAFFKDIRDKLIFRRIGIEVQNRKGEKQEFTEVISFFPIAQPKKTMVETDDNFAWPEQQ